MIKEKSCGAVVYRDCGGKRMYLVEHMVQGHVSLPKGHVEGNETEEETAKREILEETNLEARVDSGFRHVISYSPYRGCIKDVVFFVAEARDGELINQECEVSALEWLSYEDARAALSFASDQETLELAAAYLDGAGKGESA